ncbi:aldehyde dehydrogenase family protein [Bradyrhizobium brasilense]|uniref:aldehyde dehydrogenase family protein n=1 Tax=Bradyrhizobium brasilense TaxID=1419277 RepID=UPI000976823F|nr:aldehyde dehydrogenase family protein [Bradyrhizobium brasilense]OMI00060.1 aldehyde dehydrogenase family protein [Bradyrhizobium brasilense]
MSKNCLFYIDGAWVEPAVPRDFDVVDPSSEEKFASISLGSVADVNKAVAAASRAFRAFGSTTPAERVELLERVVAVYRKRSKDLGLAVSREMGAPRQFAVDLQVGIGAAHLEKMTEVLRTYAFEYRKGSAMIVKEPIGVVGMITPWNWPLNQITCKVAPALAAGCTMILKPSEIVPLDAIIFAEIMDEAGVPAGVFNLVNGDGPTVGAALAAHAQVDMISFTGSTRAGVLVAKAAADTVKRVHQELGGKSANIPFPDVDFDAAVTKGVSGCYLNSGQSCNAPTRMFVPADRQDEVMAIAKRAAEAYVVGPADAAGTTMGPVVSQTQFDKIQSLIASGIEERATLVTGGLGRPGGLNRGYYVKPTVFGNVMPHMRIAREEIFGPVLSIIPYQTTEQAIELAEDTTYGLASYVQTRDLDQARRVARRLRTGNVHINYPAWDAGVAFGGYKQSGNGREYAEFGLEDFLEIKGILGYAAE